MLSLLFSIFLASPAQADTAFNLLDVVGTETLNRPALAKADSPAGVSLDCSTPDQKLALKKKDWVYNGEVISADKVFLLEAQGVSSRTYVTEGQRHDVLHYLLSLKLLLDEEKPALLFCKRDQVRPEQ